jgi:aspartyl-tRNA(Asn)/glutamyl-tRNA(Gln) amidotransferase subunit B
MQWETVIGLEVHAQLNTNTKIFSGSATAYGAMPNTQACALDLALPGTLPVLNKEVIEKAVALGLAIGAKVHERSIFDRKNYFYPDLPKGYQTSQLYHPIVGEGEIEITLDDGSTRTIGVTRAHLEEDAGKSLHEDFQGMTGIDLNRAGTPLLEIVSEPDMRNAKEAVAYLKTLHTLVQYLNICDGNMQEGSFRCDANVSVRPMGQKELGTRTELKNINSFRFVERAINYEIQRQIELIEDGGTVAQETRLYDADKNETRPMRSKAEANDYRYFPCPDLLPVEIDQSYIEAVRAKLPELPQQKKQRLINDYELSAYDASIIVAHQDIAQYFEAVVSATSANAKLAANWVMGELSAALNKGDVAISDSPVTAQNLALLLDRIADNTISGKIAKTVFEAMWENKGSADEIIESQGLKQVTDTSAIEAIIDEVIASNPGQLEQYRSGKDKLFGFFVGQVMKLSKGKANPAQVNALLKSKLAP